MLVNRWGTLRRAVPASVGLKKTGSLVRCLCILHNYCVDERLLSLGGNRTSSQSESDVAPPLDSDYFNLLSEGAIPLERDPTGHNNNSPEQLLRGGEHFDSVPRDMRRRILNAEAALARDSVLPRDKLHSVVVEKNLKRPTPIRWLQ